MLKKNLVKIGILSFSFGSLMANEALTVVGSTSVMPIATAGSKGYAKKTKKIVTVQGGGSGKGVDAAKGGATGMVSRDLKPEEIAAGLVATPIGYDALVLITAKDSKVVGVTSQNVMEIFSGTATDWSKVGGAAGKIDFYGNDETHGTYGAFLDLFKIAKMAPAFQGMTAHNQVIFKVKANPMGIGFVSYVTFDKEVIQKKETGVKAIKVDDVEPTLKNLTDGTYKIKRPLSFVTKGAPTGTAKEFIDFMLSDEGQAIVKENQALGAK